MRSLSKFVDALKRAVKRSSANSQILLLILFTVALFLAPYRLRHETLAHRQFIVWNVGQGLWTTWVQDEECWHFDMGGERTQHFTGARTLCSEGKLNRLFLSHWDWDHVGFVPQARRLDWNICVAQIPGGQVQGVKTQILEGLPSCPLDPKDPRLAQLWDVTNGDPPQKIFLKNRSNNHDSHVFEIKSLGILIPGDSTIDEELFWRRKVHVPIRGLVLGHHGSRTSTSEALLRVLPRLQWAIASQRFRRFHHPHPEVVKRLRDFHVPLLKTEDWGNIHLLI